MRGGDNCERQRMPPPLTLTLPPQVRGEGRPAHSKSIKDGGSGVSPERVQGRGHSTAPGGDSTSFQQPAHKKERPCSRRRRDYTPALPAIERICFNHSEAAP